MAKTATGSLCAKLLYVPLQVAAGIVIARQLGPSDFGLYSFVLAAVNLLLIPAQMGYPAFLVRVVPTYLHTGELGLLRGLVRNAYSTVAVASLCVVVVTHVLARQLGLVPEGLTANGTLLGLFLLVLLAIAATSSGLLSGLGKVVLGQFSGEVARAGLLLACLAMIFAYKRVGWSASDAVLANVVATSGAVGLGAWSVRRQIGRLVPSIRAHYDCRVWFKGALPFLILAGTQAVNYYADMLMLTYMMSPRDVGLYRAAVQVADGVGMFLVAIATAIKPTLSALQAAGDWGRIRRLLVMSHRVGAGLVALVGLAISAFGSQVLELLYGVQYSSGREALVLLLAGKALYATVAFGGVALSMLGEAKVASRITAGAMLLNVLLNTLLIPRIGINGAALATMTSEFVLSVVCLMWMRRSYGYDFSAVGWRG